MNQNNIPYTMIQLYKLTFYTWKYLNLPRVWLGNVTYICYMRVVNDKKCLFV